MRQTRKILIAIVLLMVMLLSCILPTIRVNAAEDVVITLNGPLYNGIKKNLQSQNIPAQYNDAQHTLFMSQSAIDSVVTLELANCEIKDLTGLDTFKNVTTLDLSSNELTQDSNLAVLSSLPLTRLDLSTNQLESVSAISNLSTIPDVNLHNQTFSTTQIISLDISEASDQITSYTATLPEILKEAGSLSADWFNATTEGDASINWTTTNINSVLLTVAANNGESYTPYTGRITLEIKITDSNNPLSGSVIYQHYIIVTSDQTGIVFKDENLYNAVKTQLTKKQTKNKELISYGESSETDLYKKAYDASLVLVIDTNTLINKIPSLVLHDEKIEDLTGLEQFIGLESHLNLSYNYIDSINQIVELEGNKDAKETELRTRVSAQIALIKKVRDDAIEKISKMDTLDSEIAEINDQIKALKDEEEQQNKKTELENQVKAKGEEKAKLTGELKKDQALIVTRLKKLYEIYNQVYKFTGLLTLDLNQMSETELNNASYERVKELLKAQIERIINFDDNKVLSDIEEKLLISYFKIETTRESEAKYKDSEGKEQTAKVNETIENPVKEHFDYVLKNYLDDSDEYNKTWCIEQINLFKEVNIYAMMENYCLLQKLAGVDEKDYKFNYNNNCQEDREVDCTKNDAVCFIRGYVEQEIEKQTALGNLRIADRLKSLLSMILVHEKNDWDNIDIDHDSDWRDDWVKYYNDICTDPTSEINFSENGEGMLDIVMALSGKFTTASAEEVTAYVTLPRLKNLNINANLIENIDEITALTELQELYVYKNQLGSIDTVNWEALTNLKILNLGYNFISNIKKLEVLHSLEELDVSKNLLGGAFDFTLTNMSNLKKANFSYNQYDDIASLVNQYQFMAKGAGFKNVGDYLVKNSNAPKILFYNQTLSETLNITKQGDTVTVDLPKIFTQFEQLDYARTCFGVESLTGSITNKGNSLILDTKNTGTFTAKVIVNTENGDEVPISGLSMGDGTTYTVTYTVSNGSIENISISPETVTIEKGGTQQFTSNITGENVIDRTVQWSVMPDEGSDKTLAEGTTISDTGLLTIAQEEENVKLKVTATASADSTKVAEAIVTIVEEETKEIDLGYDIEENYIIGIGPKTPIEDFKTILTDEYTVTVKDATTKEEITTGNMKTGMLVEIQDTEGNVLEDAEGNLLVYEAVIKGDANGDGVANALDSNYIKAHRNEIVTLEGVQFLAADIDNNGKIEIKDSKLLLYHRAEVSGYNLNYTK